jgi:hypothetical protein
MTWKKVDIKRAGRAKYDRGFCTCLSRGRNIVLSFHEDDNPKGDSVSMYYNEDTKQIAITEGEGYRLGKVRKSARRYITVTCVLRLLGVQRRKGARYPVTHGEVDGKPATIVDLGVQE